jgi:hypothetical protein
MKSNGISSTGLLQLLFIRADNIFLIRKFLEVAIFWYIVPCSPYMYRLFRGIYTSVFKVKNQPSKKAWVQWPGRMLVSCLADFRRCRWRWYVPPKLGLPYFFGSNPGHIFEIT